MSVNAYLVFKQNTVKHKNSQFDNREQVLYGSVYK